MSKRTVKTAAVKSLVLRKGDRLVVGLDVHKKTVYAALRCNGEPVRTWVMPMCADAVVASLLPLKAALQTVAYEAGPTGYGLARALERAGLPVKVLAPGKILRPANRGSKTDRLDCQALAEYAERNRLPAIAIPTESEEADRQVARLREQVVSKLRRVKQQIKSLLLEYSLPEPPGLARWTQAGVAALPTLGPCPQLQLALDVLVEELAQLAARKRRIEEELRKLLKEKRHQANARRLDTHPGVGPRTAAAYLLEVYQPQRFARAEELTSYVGLAPRVRQSGETRHEGPLVKAGRGALRALLIEASWRWRQDDPHAATLYARLVRNTGKPQKAIVALARHLAVNLWCMLCRGEDYRPAAGAVVN